MGASRDQDNALKQAHERLRSLIELSSDWFWEQDKELRFISHPPRDEMPFGLTLGTVLGMDQHDVVGKTRWELPIDGVSEARWLEHKQTLAAHLPFRNFTYQRTLPDGQVRHICVSGVAVFDADGNFEGYRGIGSDITQRVEAARVLRESEARFRNLIELSSDWYWEQDEQMRFTYLSNRAFEKLGFNTEESYGKSRWELPDMTPLSSSWTEHRAILAAREPFRDFEYRHVGNDGKIRYVSVSGAPVFNEDGRFTGYCGIGQDITQRKMAEERVQYIATHDGLTGLPNRTLFSEILNVAIHSAERYGRDFAVLFIDLDRFKLINDTLGHEAGDNLLREMGARIAHCLRISDVVARLGGDEFVVLVQEVIEHKNVAMLAQKILTAITNPIVLLGQECSVTASIGICMYPIDAVDEHTLMKNADVAMYRAKDLGKNNYQFYSRDIKCQSLDRLALETNLRHALEGHQFFLHYQAKLDLTSGEITGVEALLRWQHPQLGIIMPSLFIPLAEETGLIVPIGKWVLRTACEQNIAWQREGIPPLCMAVNLSARQLNDDDLLTDIAQVLQRSGMAPQLLELELTESMVMQQPERIAKLLEEIKRLGVRLAIDDFGTGYSSLAQLKHFPIDTLKVDRSFIIDIPQNSEDRAITEAIIALGKALSLTIVAEGVETLAQQNFLRDSGGHAIQGYYFSEPVAPEQFAELWHKHGKVIKPPSAGKMTDS